MRNLIRYLTVSLAWIVILVGLIVGGLRLTFANIEWFQSPIQSWLSDEVIPGINFAKIRCSWRGINPVFELDEVAIVLPDRSRPVAIDSIAVEIDLWHSLIISTPVVLELSGVIEKITLRKEAQNRWWINDINLNAAQSSETLGDIEAVLESIPHYLNLELKRLIIEDNTNQRVHLIDNIFAAVQNHEDATHIQLLASLPKNFGGLLALNAQLKDGTGQVHFRSQRFAFDPITTLLDIPIRNLRRAEFGGEAWIELSNNLIDSVSADISINKARYQEKLDEPALPFAFGLKLNAKRQAKDWQISTHFSDIIVDDRKLPELNAQFRSQKQTDGKRLQGWVESLELADYMGLSKKYIDADWHALLKQSSIRGKLEDVVFDVNLQDPSSLQLSARASGLASQPVASLPGIDKIDADFTFTTHQFEVQLIGKDLTVDYADEFRAPLQINDFDAHIFADISSQFLTISVPQFTAFNDDLDLRGRLWFEQDASDRPFLYLRAGAGNAIGAQKSKYLPLKLLPAPVVSWLDAGIRSADISNAELLFHGRLQDLEVLEQQQSGEFYAGFDVNDTEVMFDSRWPLAQQGSGRVLFHNMGVEVDIDRFSFTGVDDLSGKVSLPNFADASIEVNIAAAATADKALQSWLSIPPGKSYRELARNLQELEGNVETQIAIIIPLEDEGLSEKVTVDLTLKEVAYKAPNWGSELSAINGKLDITEREVSARAIKANYFKDPVSINIRTDQKKQQTIIEGRGLLEVRKLLNLLPQRLKQNIDGKSLWQVALAIANTRQKGDSAVLTVTAKSDLKGITISIPTPYRKGAKSKRAAIGTVKLEADGDISFVVNYNSQLQTRGRLGRNKAGEFELLDLDAAFATALKPKASNGIRLYGNLTNLPMDDWIAYYRMLKAQRKPGDKSYLPLLQTMDLNIETLELSGRTVRDTDFLLIQTPRGFSGSIDSSATKGEFEFPWENTVQTPVVFSLDYLRIDPATGKSDFSGWLPNDLFNMRFHSKAFAYGDRQVVDLEIDSSLDGDSLLLDTLVFSHNDLKFKANGYWLYNPKNRQHTSNLQMSVNGDEFGQSMAALGFGDTIHNGTIRFNGELKWPAGLINPSWNLLSGKGRIRLEDGILKDVEPGSGRFVGLLSLSALPRRLSLDFSDVLFDGMEFDEIKGDLTLVGQSLQTSNTELEGPAASIKMIGKTGLRDRDYDQQVFVVPKIRQTLPVIGTITSGSAVGWGLLLLQNLFKSSIDDSLEVEYRITGSWDEPLIEAVNEPEPETEVEKKPPRGRNFEK